MIDIEDSLWEEYFYPSSDVLKNNFDCRNYDKLKELEATYSFDRLLELREKDVPTIFDKECLKNVHRYIFQDVYPFAGEYRKVNLMKARGSFLYMKDVSDIEKYLDEIFDEANNRLKNCHGKGEFADILAKIYSDLIYCHPFREGNGRSIREFVREFSISKSRELNLGDLELDWKAIDRSELNQYIEVSHIFPGATSLLFNKALKDIKTIKTK